jgi:rare lipoprotein A
MCRAEHGQVLGSVRRFLPLALGTLLGAGCAHSPFPGHGRILGEGLASFYGPGLYGKRTASGERLEPGAHVAAHRSLAFGTCLIVQTVSSGRTTRVHVADRGPFVNGRVLDVSEAAAEALGFRAQGVAVVRFWRCDVPP